MAKKISRLEDLTPDSVSIWSLRTLQQWADYLCGAACGLCVGGMANGFYDWPAIKAVFDAITNIFGKK